MNPSSDNMTIREPWSQRKIEILLLILSSILLCVFRSYFVITDTFGERDAARLANNAINLHNSGGIFPKGGINQISALYVHFLKLLLDGGVQLPSLPRIMSYINMVFGSIIIFPIYFLTKRLLNVRIAIFSIIFINFTPSFWLGTIYGFPTLLAYTFFLTSIYLFLGLVDDCYNLPKALQIFFILMAYSIALTLKTDIILCSGAFLGLLWLKGKLDIKSFIMIVSIIAVGLIMSVQYPKLFSSNQGNTLGFLKNFNKSFPFTIDGLLNHRHRLTIFRSFGKPLFFFSLFSVLFVCLFHKQYRKLIGMLVIWAVPPILFWGLIIGNAARHNLSATLPIIIIVVLGVFLIFNSDLPKICLFSISLLIFNYFSTHPSMDTQIASTRIFESPPLIHSRLKAYHEIGKRVASGRADITKISVRGKVRSLKNFGMEPFIEYESYLLSNSQKTSN
jgi:hypothetical protein